MHNPPSTLACGERSRTARDEQSLDYASLHSGHSTRCTQKHPVARCLGALCLQVACHERAQRVEWRWRELHSRPRKEICQHLRNVDRLNGLGDRISKMIEMIRYRVSIPGPSARHSLSCALIFYARTILIKLRIIGRRLGP